MKQIIAIGGGVPSQNRLLEQYIIKQTGKENPKICFLTQASNEDSRYTLRLYDTFGALGAQLSSVSLFGRVNDSYKKKLLEQDIIFVGGGNTRSMLAIWREWGVDKLLHQAYEQGTLLTGSSAGGICWFGHGITDSVWPLGVLDCLNFITGSCCPHYDSEQERRPFYLNAVQTKSSLPGIALQDEVAAHFIDGKLHKTVTSIKNNKAFLVSETGEEELNTHNLCP